MWDGNPYSRWRLSYAILLPFALVFEVGAFLVPIWLFHQLMMRRKAECVREADQCSREITELQLELAKQQPEGNEKTNPGDRRVQNQAVHRYRHNANLAD